MIAVVYMLLLVSRHVTAFLARILQKLGSNLPCDSIALELAHVWRYRITLALVDSHFVSFTTRGCTSFC